MVGYNSDNWYAEQWVDSEPEEGMYEYCEYEEILQETPKARLFKLVNIDNEMWIPKHLSDVIDDEWEKPEVGVPVWFAKKKGII